MTAEHVLQQLQNKIYPLYFIISKEKHIDGKIHFHVLIISKKKVNIQTPNRLDIEFKGETFHGKYQTVNLLAKVVEYICKDKEYISNIQNLQDGKILEYKEFVLQRAKIVG